MTYLTKYMTCEKSDRISHTYISPKMFPFIKNLFTGVQAIEILMCDKLVWVKNSKSAKRILHLCPNVKNSIEFITPAWGIRSVRNTVQQCFAFSSTEILLLLQDALDIRTTIVFASYIHGKRPSKWQIYHVSCFLEYQEQYVYLLMI